MFSDFNFSKIHNFLWNTPDPTVSDNSNNPNSLLGPIGTSAVVLFPSTNCATKFYANGNNWITSSKTNQSAYRSELACVIAALTILDVFIWYHDITSSTVTIALNGEFAFRVLAAGPLMWTSLLLITFRLFWFGFSCLH